MNFNVREPSQPSRNFAARFTEPLYTYIVGPRIPEDDPYIADLDFTQYPLRHVPDFFMPNNGDTLEIFWLVRRVQLQALHVQIIHPAQVVFRPHTNTNMANFIEVDCSHIHDTTYAINGGVVDSSTDLLSKAIVIDDPDYLGFRIEQGAGYLTDLHMRVSLIVSDAFPWNMQTNSPKKDGFGK